VRRLLKESQEQMRAKQIESLKRKARPLGFELHERAASAVLPAE
jgi:hypothetical protein